MLRRVAVDSASVSERTFDNHRGQQWDITAKLPTTGDGAPSVINGRLMPPPMGTALEMLRALLIERFELKMHTESRETTALSHATREVRSS